MLYTNDENNFAHCYQHPIEKWELWLSTSYWQQYGFVLEHADLMFFFIIDEDINEVALIGSFPFTDLMKSTIFQKEFDHDCIYIVKYTHSTQDENWRIIPLMGWKNIETSYCAFDHNFNEFLKYLFERYKENFQIELKPVPEKFSKLFKRLSDKDIIFEDDDLSEKENDDETMNDENHKNNGMRRLDPV